jgi:hypothetical protein
MLVKEKYFLYNKTMKLEACAKSVPVSYQPLTAVFF